MKIIRLTLFLLMLSFQFVSCKKDKKEIKIATTFKKESHTDLEEKDVNINSDDFTFPVDSLLKVKLLWTEVFHNDEVDPNLESKIWFGLFKKGNNYSFSKTDISIKKAYDPVLDEDESEKTGWEVSALVKDTCIVLVEKLPDFVEKNVQFVKVPKRIYPEESFDFQFLGTQYKLFATGKKTKETPDSDWWIVSDYKLYLTANINGVKITELLTAKKSFDEQMIKIIFAGDIDGDDKLDLIIDTANHYNVSSLTLYLSKSAEKNKVIKPVGVFNYVGC